MKRELWTLAVADETGEIAGVTVHESAADAFASLRENFDGLGEFDTVDDSQLIREMSSAMGYSISVDYQGEW